MAVRLTSVGGGVSTHRQNNQVRDQSERTSTSCEAIQFKWSIPDPDVSLTKTWFNSLIQLLPRVFLLPYYRKSLFITWLFISLMIKNSVYCQDYGVMKQLSSLTIYCNILLQLRNVHSLHNQMQPTYHGSLAVWTIYSTPSGWLNIGHSSPQRQSKLLQLKSPLSSCFTLQLRESSSPTTPNHKDWKVLEKQK